MVRVSAALVKTPCVVIIALDADLSEPTPALAQTPLGGVQEARSDPLALQGRQHRERPQVTDAWASALVVDPDSPHRRSADEGAQPFDCVAALAERTGDVGGADRAFAVPVQRVEIGLVERSDRELERKLEAGGACCAEARLAGRRGKRLQHCLEGGLAPAQVASRTTTEALLRAASGRAPRSRRRSGLGTRGAERSPAVAHAALASTLAAVCHGRVRSRAAAPWRARRRSGPRGSGLSAPARVASFSVAPWMIVCFAIFVAFSRAREMAISGSFATIVPRPANDGNACEAGAGSRRRRRLREPPPPGSSSDLRATSLHSADRLIKPLQALLATAPG